MALYRFNVIDSLGLVDETGTHLADDETAKRQAIRFAGELLSQDPTELMTQGQMRIEVLDADNLLFFAVSIELAEAPAATVAAGASSLLTV